MNKTIAEMTENEINILADKWRKGTLSPDEKLRFEQWYHSFNDTELSHDVPEEQLGLAIYNNILSDPDFQSNKAKKIIWTHIVAAAAVAIFIFGAGLFYFTNKEKISGRTEVYANDIAPGKMGATLILANGKKIKLSDASNGEIAKEAGVVISKTGNGQLTYELNNGSDTELNKENTLSTANGETYQLRLPDGSLVWLNAASTLTYAANLIKDGKRKVMLQGEGYFEITKDKDHPFIVESDGQEVEVLGTHFNVNVYKNESQSKTTLLEGSVKISANGFQKMLRPGFEAVSTGSGIELNKVNAQDAVGWKDGLFLFEAESLQSIMRRVARWYNVEVIYSAGVDKDKRYGGGVSRYEHVSKVLEKLELTGNIHFKIEGRRIVVMK